MLTINTVSSYLVPPLWPLILGHHLMYLRQIREQHSGNSFKDLCMCVCVHL